MPRRRFITAAGTAAAILLAAPNTATATGRVQPLPASAAARPVPLRPVPPLTAGPALVTCEHRLELAARHAPTLAVVGASFTAGVGPGAAGRSWAVQLARLLHWNAVVDGVPGAGYVRAGRGGQGPVGAELARIGLRALAPSLIIIQAGHDDVGVPVRVVQQRVSQAIALIRAQAPHARIALITVFTRHSRLARQHGAAAAYRTDRVIVAAATAAARNVIIMDPLAARWAFARSRDGLHPSRGGSAWIARKVAAVLRSHGITAAGGSAAARAPLVCDAGISPERFRPPAALAARHAPPRQESRG